MRNSYKYLLIATISLMISSCSVLKPYQEPSIDAPTSYRNNDSQDSTSIANIEWKRFFTDTLLQEHINNGLNNNYNLLAAIENIKIASLYLQQSKANFLPTLNSSFESGYVTPSRNSLQGINFQDRKEFVNYNLGLSSSWEIDVWGKLSSQKKAALASYLKTVAAQQAIKSQVVAAIANNYYLLLMYDKQEGILKETIENRRKSIETIKALKSAGQTTEVGVKQTEAQLYTAEGLLIDTENQIKVLENALSILEGIAPTDIKRTTLSQQQLDSTIAVGVPIQLLSNRPDIIAAEQNLMQSFQLKNMAYASMFPNLSISASGGLNSMNFSDIFSVNSIFANILGSLTQPIFNKKLLRTNYKVNESKQQIALYDYKQAVLNGYREVSDALYNYDSSNRKMQVKVKENDALTAAVDFSIELQKQGLGNYLEVLRANDNALNTQLTMAQIEFNKLSAIVKLYNSLGGGWK